MHTMKRIAYSPILEAVALYDIKERTALTMRDITQAHHLAVARDMTIDLLKQRNQFLDESLTFLKSSSPLRAISCSHISISVTSGSSSILSRALRCCKALL